MSSVKFTRLVLPAVTFALVLGLAAPVMAQTTPPAGSGVPPTPAPGAITVAPATSGKTTATSGSGVLSNTSPVTKPAAMASTTTGKLPAGDEYKTVALATAHCPSDTVVWSTLSKSKSYHLATSKYYGKTKHGAYVCEKDAATYGFHASKE
jgi:hypothetical protein